MKIPCQDKIILGEERSAKADAMARVALDGDPPLCARIHPASSLDTGNGMSSASLEMEKHHNHLQGGERERSLLDRGASLRKVSL